MRVQTPSSFQIRPSVPDRPKRAAVELIRDHKGAPHESPQSGLAEVRQDDFFLRGIVSGQLRFGGNIRNLMALLAPNAHFS